MSYLYVTEDGASMGIDGGYYVVNCKDGVTKNVGISCLIWKYRNNYSVRKRAFKNGNTRKLFF